MEFAISLGWGGWIALVVGALAFGVIVQLTTDTPSAFAWLVDAIAAFIGALFASEIVIAWRTVEPVWDGLALVPAVLGGLVVGVVVDLVMRFLTGGRTAGRPMAA
jgi:uncharacterized membrane protein YeaQ/YmgE (transglycosylase-associated protein family)